jgi:hypothetical protein
VKTAYLVSRHTSDNALSLLELCVAEKNNTSDSRNGRRVEFFDGAVSHGSALTVDL